MAQGFGETFYSYLAKKNIEDLEDDDDSDLDKNFDPDNEFPDTEDEDLDGDTEQDDGVDPDDMDDSYY